MYKNYKEYAIIKNEKKLRIKSEKCISLEEGQEISKILFSILAQHPNGIGLSAIQIGIPKKVFVINVSEPLYFVNSEIIEKKYPIIFEEGCLSFPGKYINTKRFASIKVKADNLKSEVNLGYLGDLESDTKQNPKLQVDTKILMESVAFQHEHGHTLGKLMYDFQFKMPDYTVDKIGRNKEILIISNLGEEKVLKYKKALPLLKDGLWRIKE